MSNHHSVINVMDQCYILYKGKLIKISHMGDLVGVLIACPWPGPALFIAVILCRKIFLVCLSLSLYNVDFQINKIRKEGSNKRREKRRKGGRKKRDLSSFSVVKSH